MRKIISFIILVFCILTLATCTNNKEEILYKNSTSSCDTTNVTFKAKVVPILAANCLSCHGNSVAAANGGSVRLQDYADVKSHSDHIYGSIAHLPGYIPMPKNMTNTIDNCQIKIIQKWLQQGALDN